MANLNEQSEYAEGIYQLETTDPVVGGPDGLSNTQAKQLEQLSFQARITHRYLVELVPTRPAA